MRLFMLLLFVQVAGCSGGQIDLARHGDERSPGYRDVSQPTYQLSQDGVADFVDRGLSFYETFETEYGYALLPDFRQRLTAAPFELSLAQLPLNPTTYVPREDGCGMEGHGTLTKQESCANDSVCLAVDAFTATSGYGPKGCGEQLTSLSRWVAPSSNLVTILEHGELLANPDDPDALKLNAKVPFVRRTAGYNGPWAPISPVGAPPFLLEPRAFWTGSKVLVFGKTVDGQRFDGASYDLEGGTWSPLASDARPVPTETFTTLVVDGRLYVFTSGGGAVLDPVANTWTALPQGVPAFGADTSFAAAAGDGKIFLFGATAAEQLVGVFLDVAGGATAWTAIDMTGAPKTTQYTEAVWTNVGVLVWAGGTAMYYPNSGRWSATEAPAALNATDPAESLAHLLPVKDGVAVIPYMFPGRLPNVALASPNVFSTVDGTWKAHEASNLPVYRPLHQATDSAWLVGYGDWPFSDGLGHASFFDPADDAQFWRFQHGGFLYDFDANKRLDLPKSPSAPSDRADAATLLVGDRLFVWGGCATKRLEDGACLAPLKDGAVARVLLPH